jgi:AcrR family transcriptional regulator
MANTTRPSVRNVSADRATNGGAGREPDPRAARTTGALGRALVALLEERAFDAITVQDILDRAGVGRTAFYAHYRNKHDVLFSSYEGMLAAFDGLVDRPSPFGAPGSRLFPVGEFLAHVGDARRLVRALARDGLLGDVWAMLAGEATRVIARRLDAWSAGVPDAWRPGGAGAGRAAPRRARAPCWPARSWRACAGGRTTPARRRPWRSTPPSTSSRAACCGASRRSARPARPGRRQPAMTGTGLPVLPRRNAGERSSGGARA